MHSAFVGHFAFNAELGIDGGFAGNRCVKMIDRPSKSFAFGEARRSECDFGTNGTFASRARARESTAETDQEADQTDEDEECRELKDAKLLSSNGDQLFIGEISEFFRVQDLWSGLAQT